MQISHAFSKKNDNLYYSKTLANHANINNASDASILVLMIKLIIGIAN